MTQSLEIVDVQLCWDFIKPKIERIVSELPWRDFRPEDIYNQCVNGQAAVFVDPAVPWGDSFFVARMEVNKSTGEKTMLLWIAHSSMDETASRSIQTIEDVARENNCHYLEFITAHEKIVEYGRMHGFDRILHQCRKSLEPVEKQPEDAALIEKAA